jgi:DNA primase
MPAIKPTCIRDLKFRVNIVDVVSRVATLKKAGARFKGLCPFHQEKSPSFHVDPDKGYYKCFGCGKAGDIISFVRETEQLNFTEAIEALGQRFGVPIEYEEGSGPTREERSLRQEIFDLHEVAAEHFHQVFKNAGVSGDYMREYWQKKRRFPMEIADEFKIGAADPADNSLAAALLKKKFSEDALRQCGLFFVREGNLITLGSLKPRFRGRLMIPIRDHQGRVVAFTARQTDLTPADDPAREAKYVNSPETPIFTKGNLLFNLDRARTAAGDGHPFVMVEGQLDALRCWQVGLKTAIAPQGTSITEGQLVLLRRYHPQVECFFDSDSAGQKAALRFLPMALKAGLEIRFLAAPGDGKIDPDILFLERGLAAYDEVKRSAVSAMTFASRSILPSPETASAEHKTRASQNLFEIITATESETTRAQFLEEIATNLRLPLSAIQRDFDAFKRRHSKIAAPAPSSSADAPAPVVTKTINTANTPEHHLLLMCLHFEQLGKPLSTILPHDWIDSSHLPGALLNRFLAEFEHDAWPGRDHLDALLENPEEKTLVASLLFDPPRTEEPLRAVNQALVQIRARFLEPQLRQIELALATHGPDSNFDALSLIKQRTDIQRQLRAPFGLPAAV